MSETTLNRLRAAVVAIAPLVLLIGFLYLPYVSDYTDEAKVASEVAGDSTRWAWAAIILSTGIGLMLAAATIIRARVAAAGEHGWSSLAMFLLLVGGTLSVAASARLGYTYAEGAGQDVQSFASAANDWAALGLVAAVIFGLGWLSLAAAIYRGAVLPRQETWLVVLALVVLTVTLFVPMGWAQYVTGVAAIVAFWPIAYELWGAPSGQGMMMGRPAHA